MDAVVSISTERFDALVWLEPGRYYAVYSGGSAHIAWSPDGVGVYWYEDLAEAMSQHG